jgi:hypothetical protein
VDDLLERMHWLQDRPYQAFSTDVAYSEVGKYGRAA